MANRKDTESDLSNSEDELQQNIRPDAAERLVTEEDSRYIAPQGSAAKSVHPATLQSQYTKGFKGGSDDKGSVDANRKPQDHFKSPVQRALDDTFENEFLYKAGNTTHNKRDTRDTFKPEIVEHEETVNQKLNKLLSYKAPLDAVGPKKI